MASLIMKTVSIMVLKCALLSLCKILVTTFFLILIELWSGHALDSFHDKDIIQPIGGDIEPLDKLLRFWIWVDFIIQNQSVLRDEQKCRM